MLLSIHRLHKEVEPAAAAERKLDLYWLDNRHTHRGSHISRGQRYDRRATVNDNDDVFV